MQYTGGYYVIKEPIFKSGLHEHSSQDEGKISKVTLNALNAIQETEWKVNTGLLSTVVDLWTLGENVANQRGELVLQVTPPKDPRKDHSSILSSKLDPSLWEAMSSEDKKAWADKRRRILDAFDSDCGKYRATLRTIETANLMSKKEVFWFPHNMDFRTRIYPIPTDMNPQSMDLAKGLLTFYRGERLGASGLYWLGVGVANAMGEDKLPIDERFHWTESNLDLIIRVATDPVKNREWTEADKPFQFLALAMEMTAAVSLENPEGFISHFPIQQDGSCNGAQHLSIMARDIVGAEATNCRSGLPRQDLYMEVAERVWDSIQKLASEGNQVAVDLIPRLMKPSDRRKVVKRSVMTVPYGVTSYGIADFMMKDKHVAGLPSEWEASKLLRDNIMASIDSTLKEGRELQRYFQSCAVIVAEAGKPLCWDTPVGTKVTQAYRTMIERRIKTLAGRFTVYEPTDELGMDIKKMGLAASPNVVHSCDAAHLQDTTDKMQEVGIHSFSMIHDSYGTHAAHTEVMRNLLRESVVELYGDNYLEKWRQSVIEYTGVDIPEAPSLGNFDINEILDSEYFFS